MDLDRLRQTMFTRGVRRLYAKRLAANDNSKNQPYFGGDFSVLNLLPASAPEPADTGSYARPIFKARLRFGWMQDDGTVNAAPNAKLILYPQYPEVRFSGYLQGCSGAPSELMGTTRVPDRLLLLGVTDDGQIIGYAAAPESAIARQFAALEGGLRRIGVFFQVPIVAGATVDDARPALLQQLCRVSQLGWIDSKRLNSRGEIVPCAAPNCGGYTLEAELGISPNGYSEPDFRGWEVKQHGVVDFKTLRGGPITLFTPEPTAGYYAQQGVLAFVERYGYEDTRGREDRLNFGGVHRHGSACRNTGLTLTLLGYDVASRKITDPNGGIALVDSTGIEAAKWLYSDLMRHWNRKHAFAAYVASLTRNAPQKQYRFSSTARLGVGTDFLRFLSAVASTAIYYDPGIKIENYPDAPKSKRRSQFRIKSADLPSLYETMETVSVCA